MSDTYTKLFSSITASTIWSEPAGTRLVWITMLAMAHKDGCVYASVPGLARQANVSREETEVALECFLAPDPDSRTPEHEGRRIEVIDGGWRLLNHAKFSAIRSAEERRDYMREYMRKRRAGESDTESVSQSSKQTLAMSTESTDVTPPALALDVKERAKDKTCRTDVRRFADFWSVYPRCEGKKPALAVWKSKRLDAQADEIIADVQKRIAQHRSWREGFVPHAQKYLRNELWTDAIDSTAPRIAAAAKPLPDDDLQESSFDWRRQA